MSGRRLISSAVNDFAKDFTFPTSTNGPDLPPAQLIEGDIKTKSVRTYKTDISGVNYKDQNNSQLYPLQERKHNV